jgi:hypothetical protein
MCYHVIKTEKKEQIDKKASNKKDGFFTEGHGPVVYLSPQTQTHFYPKNRKGDQNTGYP